MGEADFILILTGISGSGKSQAGNFFMQQNVFKTNWGIEAVTTANASCTGIIEGKYIKIIDTPGFLNTHSLTHTEEFKSLAEAIVDNPNGVNAIGLVINIESRMTKEDITLLEKFLLMKNLLPYTFLVFTHAKAFGNTIIQQDTKFEELLQDTISCPNILPHLINKLDNRFMMLESIKPVEEQYFSKKSHELLQILQVIMKQNTKPFTSTFNVSHKQSKEKLLESLIEELNQKMREERLNTTSSYQGNNIWHIATENLYTATLFFTSAVYTMINRIRNLIFGQ